MRIVLTNVGKEEISKEYSSEREGDHPLILKTDSNIPEIISHSKKIINKEYLHQLIPKSKSYKYKNNIIYTENNYNNRNNVLKSGLYSLSKNYIPKNYKDRFNGLYNQDNNNNNKKRDLPLKLISLNNSNLPLHLDKKEIYNNEDNKEKNINKNDNIKDNSYIMNDNSYLNSKKFFLPKINSLSLKNLLNNKNRKDLDDNILRKEINKSDTSLINYLKLDKCIQPSFVKKINKANEQKLFKLDKICQKYFHNEKKEINLKNSIQNKIKKQYSKDAEYYKNGLKNMGKDLKGIVNIYKGLLIKMDNFKDNKYNYLKEIQNRKTNKK